MNTLKLLRQGVVVITSLLWQPGYADTGENNLWAIGTAWTPDKSDVLYREYHFAEDPNLDLTTRVEYRRPDGSVFAEKTIDYSRSLTAPEIQHIDLRNTARINTEFLEDARSAMIKVGFQAHDSNRYREELLTYRDSVVVDAGFDPFVRKHWEQLTSGESVGAAMLVPSRLDTVRISLSKTDSDRCDEASVEIHCFVVRPAGMLRAVGWFVDPIYIGYDQVSRRLMVFNGISNLRDDNDEPRNVLISFKYF